MSAKIEQKERGNPNIKLTLCGDVFIAALSKDIRISFSNGREGAGAPGRTDLTQVKVYYRSTGKPIKIFILQYCPNRRQMAKIIRDEQKQILK